MWSIHEEGKVKRLIAPGLLVGLAAFAFAAGPTTETFKGEISDSQCALNVHSTNRGHEEMLKGGMTGKTAAECVKFCVENMGGKYVLASPKAVFRLNDGKKAEAFAGEKVVVRGTLDKKTNTIAIASIEKDTGAK